MRAGASWAGVMLVALAATGCATRDWVRTQIAAEEERTTRRWRVEASREERQAREQAARTERVEAALDAQAARVEDAGARADAAAGAAREAMVEASKAGAAAAAARGHADEVDRRLTRLWAARDRRTLVGTVHVYFRFDRWELTDAAETVLLEVARALDARPGLVAELTGHTDMRGPRSRNLELSRERVEAVRRFLAGKGVTPSRLAALALGPLPDRGIPDERKRRVTVHLYDRAD